MREKRLHYTVFAVEGLNRERLFNALQKKGVTLYDVKIFGPKRAEFAVDSRELKNFFAITDNLCYNIKRVGERGLAAAFAALFRRFGVLVGALLFAAFVAAADFAVLSVDYYGSGAVYKDYAGEVLSACGVKPFAFTDDERLERAAAALLKNSDVFSFASVEKHGTRVKVNLVLSPEASGVVDTERKELVCPVDGVVESITVLRGTALVAAGDVVKKGDVLIGGYNEIKDTVYETYVLGSVRVISSHTAEYTGGEGEEEKALALAAAEVGGEIVSENVQKTPLGENKFLYTAVVEYRVRIK